MSFFCKTLYNLLLILLRLLLVYLLLSFSTINIIIIFMIIRKHSSWRSWLQHNQLRGPKGFLKLVLERVPFHQWFWPTEKFRLWQFDLPPFLCFPSLCSHLVCYNFILFYCSAVFWLYSDLVELVGVSGKWKACEIFSGY